MTLQWIKRDLLADWYILVAPVLACQGARVIAVKRRVPGYIENSRTSIINYISIAVRCTYLQSWKKLEHLMRFTATIVIISSEIENEAWHYLTLVLLRGVATTPQSVFTLVLKIAQPRGKIAPGTFKFILSLHFSEKISNLPPTPEVG